LSVLVEQVRAPGAARAEVDALLAGLSQPLPSGASPRERADLLLSLMNDAQIADYTGTGGRKVRIAASQALLALGYPYALEVPPETLEAIARDEGTRQARLSARKSQVGLGLVALSAVLALLPALFIAATKSWSSAGEMLASSLATLTVTTLLPTLLIVGRHGVKSLGLVWLTLAALRQLFFGLMAFSLFPYNLLLLAEGGLLFTGALLMRSKDSARAGLAASGRGPAQADMSRKRSISP
jgi:hypothetical protein